MQSLAASASRLLKLHTQRNALGHLGGNRRHHHLAADASHFVTVFTVAHVERGEEWRDLADNPGEGARAWRRGVNYMCISLVDWC